MGFPRGPEWKDDAFGYINTQLAELNIHRKELNNFIEENFLYMSIKQNRYISDEKS